LTASTTCIKNPVNPYLSLTKSSTSEALEIFAFESKTVPTSLDESLDFNMETKGKLFPLNKVIHGCKQTDRKRSKIDDLKPILFVRFNTRIGKSKPVPLRALLDSGGSGNLVTEQFTKKLRSKQTNSDTVWSTPGGIVSTNTKCTVEFSIPELHDARLIKGDMYVTKNLGAYDMILGRDLMTDLGIDIHFSAKSVTWDGVEIPMKDGDTTFKESFHVGYNIAMVEAATRIREILEAKYEKANLREICDKSMHLETEQQEQLFHLLSQYEELFNGELGQWDGDDYKIDLINGAMPYHAKAFPIMIPRVHLKTLKAEVQRLCNLGVLKWLNRSE
jgi:hypothetical protein